MALSGDAGAVRHRLEARGGRPGRLVDVEAVPGGPAECAEHDALGDASAVVDGGCSVDHGGGALGREVRQR